MNARGSETRSWKDCQNSRESNSTRKSSELFDRQIKLCHKLQIVQLEKRRQPDICASEPAKNAVPRLTRIREISATMATID